MAYGKRYLFGGGVHQIPDHLAWSWRSIPDPSPAGESKRAANRRRYERRKANTVGARYSLDDIAERDGYVCHLCGGMVDMSLSGRSPMGPTADHLIPVSAGGGDDEWNIALSHSRCNIKRGTRPLVTA